MTVMNNNNRLTYIVSAVLFIVQNIALAEAPPMPEKLGRLFTQPDTRAQLDLNRQHPKLVKKQTAKKPVIKTVAAVKKPTLPLPNPVTMQGYVKRSHGASTVWINHKPVQENTMVDDVKVGRLTKQQTSKSHVVSSDKEMGRVNQLVIKIPANGQYVKLKAGQAYDPKDNQIKEVTTLAQEHQVELSPSKQPTTNR